MNGRAGNSAVIRGWFVAHREVFSCLEARERRFCPWLYIVVLGLQQAAAFLTSLAWLDGRISCRRWPTVQWFDIPEVSGRENNELPLSEGPRVRLGTLGVLGVRESLVRIKTVGISSRLSVRILYRKALQTKKDSVEELEHIDSDIELIN